MSKLLVKREWYENNKDVVQMNESTSYPGLFVLKYKKKVFYDNLWTPELEQCRGLVVDADFNVVVRPFDKVFNYMENGTTFDRDDVVTYTRKVNGFLGCITLTKKYGVVCSTTGSLDSDFAKMVKDHLEPLKRSISEGTTYCFEICDERDPHIIKEDHGAYLIGAVDHDTGLHVEENLLDEVAFSCRLQRFNSHVGRFSDVVKLSKEVKHEGFMVRLLSDQSKMLKLKSPYYLVTKFFARKSEEKLQRILDNPQQARQTLDEEYYPLVDYLQEHKEQFVKMNEQQRVAYVREFLNA